MLSESEKSLRNGLTSFSAALPIFGFCMLFTVFIWENYIDPSSDFHLFIFIFGAGFFFSAVVALFVYAMELNQKKLQQDLRLNEDRLREYEAKLRGDDEASLALSWLSRIALSEQSPKQLLQGGVDLIAKILKANDGAIMLLDKDGALRVCYSSGIPELIAQNVCVKIGERVAGRVAQSKREYLITGNIARHAEFEGMQDNPKIGSSLVCPLIAEDVVIGILCLNRKKGEPDFNDTHLCYARIYAAQIAQLLHDAEAENVFLKEGVELKKAYFDASRRMSA